MRKSITLIFLLLLLLFFDAGSNAKEQYTYLVHVSPRSCTHRLHEQPNDGPFSVFVFCDDALGVNIGVILTEPGAGPGKLKLEGTKTWDKWNNTDRFWQDATWAADVTSFAWSPSYRYLYVATSAIYGDGGVFKLDLKNKKSSRIPNFEFGNHSKLIDAKGIFKTTITEFDVNTSKMTIELILRSSGNKVIKVHDIEFE
jgi:hypothetical protein